MPSAAFAQRSDSVYRIGILTLGETTELGVKQRAVFKKALMELGWTKDAIRIEYHSAANDANRIPTLVTEALKLQLAIVVSQGRLIAKELARQTKTTPVVFVSVQDPVESGIVTSLSHPGSNFTGFSNFEPTFWCRRGVGRN